MNILILGAGLMQRPAILSAKKMGYTVHVVDADSDAVAIPCADIFKKIDLKDKDSILEYADFLKKSEGGLAAVFTAGTDFSSSVSYVCEKLGLNSHSFEAAVNASVKTQMRECFEKQGIPSPKFLKASKGDVNELFVEKVCGKLSFPIVVKPVDNMGARGCRMVRSKKEFLPALKIATECSRTGFAIVEEFMDGAEFSIDALVYKGTLTVTGFAIRHIKYEPYFIEVGHTMPAGEKDITQKMHDELISVFALGAKSLGLSCGAAKADIKYTKNGPMIGEIAGRLSGGYMSGWTYPYASDLNLTEQALQIACNKEPVDLVSLRKHVEYVTPESCKSHSKPYELYEVPCKRTSAERAWLSIPGTVKYIENITEYTDKAIFDVLPRSGVKIGSDVDFPRNNVEKCGNIIAVSNQRDVATSAAEDAVSNIFITLEPNNKKTDNYLKYSEAEYEAAFPPSAFGKLTAEDIEQLSGTIPANSKVSDKIPEVLKKSKYKNLCDWNYNTIEKTTLKFDILRAKHPKLDAKKFWTALMRGGIQAAVYICDSETK